MASNNAQNPIRLGPASLKILTDYLKHILEYHKKTHTDIVNKLTSIDIAYARYKTAQMTNTSGEDINELKNKYTGITDRDITVPVVISQVDSFVGYLADVYLSGYPMFPVVSEPADRREAEMLETIIDTHSLYGGYPRQLLMSFRDGIKYNFMPMEHIWEPMEEYQIVSDYLKPTQDAQLKQNSYNITKVKRLSPYNTVWDRRVDPADVCYYGEFAGYIDIVPRIPLKRFVNMYTKSGELYNISELNTIEKGTTKASIYYQDLPTITDLLNNRTKINDDFDWMGWLGLSAPGQQQKTKTLQAGSYERFTCYARIIPSEFGMTNVPKPNSPQIWKFIMIDGKTIIFAKRIYTIFDSLPISIGQPLEDGFALQTASIGEAQMPMQDAASILFNIRFNAARRAVSDRALYNPMMISQEDVNTREPAPKIPVRLSGLNDNITLESAYHQIPYDARSTDSVIVDARSVLEMSDKLSGLNQPQQGRFQKGNKTLQEWQDTMNNADNRPRLPALNIEFQTMIPLKQQIKLNIYQYGAQGAFQNFKTGEVYNVDGAALEKMRDKVMSFRIADGYTPKSKLASTDFIAKGLETIAQVPQLAQAYGAALPEMFAHMMQLGGVRGLDQYIPKASASGQPPNGQPPAGAPANGYQPPLGATNGTGQPPQQ